MHTTNFDKVHEFHQATDAYIGQKPVLPSEEIKQLRINLIEEEVQELKQALLDDNLVEVTDALADILYVVYGAGVSFGVNLDLAFNLVHESNMSKLCETIEEAEMTQKHYAKQGIEVIINKNGDYYVINRKSDNKVLKNINYHPVNLANLAK